MLHRRLLVSILSLALSMTALILSGFAAGQGHSQSASPTARTKVVTFSKNVAPILYNKCAVCHRPAATAPMSLLTFKEARPWAKSIKEKVLDKTMPPWHADPAYGKFANDRTLSRSEIDTLVSWVDGGALEGDPKHLPALPRFPEDWKIGKPDMVFTMPAKFAVPAQGVVDYQYFSVPTQFTEDRWVQAAEVRVGNPSVVHHVIVFIQPPQNPSDRNQSLRRGADLDALTGVAPGEEPMILPDGVGARVKAGSLLIFQMHYTPNGTAQSDQTSVGLVFSKKPVVKESMGGAALNARFTIPPGNANYEVRSSYTIDDDSHITSLMPHMHFRGKDFQYRLVYPDGTSKILLSVPRYNFNWQTNYQFAEPVAAPKGSRIDCIAHFDNSAGNKANPDPTKLVRWGDQTFEEMMIGFIEYTLDQQNLQQAQSPATQQAQLSASAKPAETKPAEALPSVDEVLDHYVQAIGGKAAVQAQSSCVMKGTLAVPSYGADGTIVIYGKAPNKQLTEIASATLGNSRVGFNGAMAWQEEDGEVKDLSVFPKREADFYFPLKLRELFPKIEVKGKEKVGNIQAWRLEAPRGGTPKRWYFDVESGLLLRTEVRSAEGELLKSETYEDYRAVDGVKIPFTIRSIEDHVEAITKLSEVKHNVQIDDAQFEKPAAKKTPAAPPAKN
jgi:hypothetical protein